MELKKLDVICLGEALIDFISMEYGKKLKDVEMFKKVAGGAPANVAVGIAKLKKKSAFLGRIGKDEFGEFIKDCMESAGVDCSQLQYDRNARTGLAFISLPNPNEREFLFYRNPSADMRLDSGEFNKDFIKNTKIFHFGSVTLIDEPARSATMKGVQIARESGSIISYDPNLRLDLWCDVDKAKMEIFSALNFADIVKVDCEELFFLTGEKEIDRAMDNILSEGPGLCLVTLGEEGCYYKTRKLFGKLAAYKVNTVDSNGCGDSFVSAILFKIIENSFDNVISNKEIMLSVIKFASAAAAITSTKIGVIPSLPSVEEVENFLWSTDS